MAEEAKEQAPKGAGKPKSKKKEGAEAAAAAPGGPAAKGKKGMKADEAAPAEPARPPRLRQFYKDSVVPALMQRFGYKNRLQAPRLEKIVVNMGIGEAIANSKLLDAAVEDLRHITGQQPVVTKAKKSIANFKLREGMSVGCRVTLRGARMYEFFDRLVNVALPRIRDFRGVPTKSFDGRGNYTLGLKEQINFPEIDYDKIMQLMGMDITVVTSAKTDEECRELLALMNMPFRRS